LNASNSSCTAVIPQNKEKFKKTPPGVYGASFATDVKTVFTFFGHVRFLRFLTFFHIPNVFYLKNVGKVQSGKQINKKHFQNSINEIDL